MAPLFLFLASSLNVELVYIILTSLSEFSKLKKSEDGQSYFDCDDNVHGTEFVQVGED